MDEAFEDDGVNCVVRQICAKFELEREDVEAEFTAIGDWVEGITPKQILEWCKRRGLYGMIVWNNALIAKHTPEQRDHHFSSCACRS